MTNTELTKIREDRKLSKKEFAALIGVTPMLLGRYEKGTCAIPESVAEKLTAAANTATATEIEVKKNTRKTARKAKEAAREAVTEVMEAVEDKAVAEEIEAKKTVRKAGRKAKEAVDAVAQSDPVVAAEIEVKKNTRKASRKAKEKVEEATTVAKESVKRAAGIPNIIIQSPMGGYITFSDIVTKVPKGAADIYVRVDENKLYYVLENGETGDVDIWD